MKKIAADRNYRIFKRARFSPFDRLLEVAKSAPSREDRNHYIINDITFDDQKFIIANPSDPSHTTECDYDCIWQFIHMLHEEERIFDKLPQTFGPMVSQNKRMESIRDSIREPGRNELIPTKLEAADRNYRILKSASALTDSQLIDYLKKHNNADLKNLQKIIKNLKQENLKDEEFLRMVANHPSYKKALNEAYYKDFPAEAPKAPAPISENVRKLQREIFLKERDLNQIQQDLYGLRQQLEEAQNKQAYNHSR